MKGLNRTLTMVKVFRIIAKIEFVCLIIAGSLSLISFLTLLLVGSNSELFKTISENTGVAYNKMLFSTIMVVISSIVYIYITNRRYNMYNSIYESGMPFTKDVVKEMRIIGLLLVCSVAVISIIQVILTLVLKEKIDMDFSSTFDFGLAMLLLSCPVEYGVEILENKNNESKMENL